RSTVVPVGGDRLVQGRQDHVGITHDAQVDIAVLADGRVVQVDLNDGGVGGQALAVAHTEVERGPDDDDQVGVGEGVAPGGLEVVRVLGGEGAGARAVHEGGHVE